MYCVAVTAKLFCESASHGCLILLPPNPYMAVPHRGGSSTRITAAGIETVADANYFGSMIPAVTVFK